MRTALTTVLWTVLGPVLFVVLVGFAPAGFGQGAHREGVVSGTVERAFEYRYLVYTPPTYGEDEETRWPVVLFLHGSGERGDDLSKVKLHGPPKLLERGEGIWASFPAIVVSPQCPAGERWDVDALLALLDHIEETYRVDADRVYVTGLSMGGYGTWALAERTASRLAAIAPVCGGYPYASAAAPEALRRLPTWAFHGANDRVVPVRETVEVCEFMERAGCDVRWTIYEGVGHVSWPRAYGTDELWVWMLSQNRASRRAGGR